MIKHADEHAQASSTHASLRCFFYAYMYAVASST